MRLDTRDYTRENMQLLKYVCMCVQSTCLIHKQTIYSDGFVHDLPLTLLYYMHKPAIKNPAIQQSEITKQKVASRSGCLPQSTDRNYQRKTIFQGNYSRPNSSPPTHTQQTPTHRDSRHPPTHSRHPPTETADSILELNNQTTSSPGETRPFTLTLYLLTGQGGMLALLLSSPPFGSPTSPMRWKFDNTSTHTHIGAATAFKNCNRTLRKVLASLPAENAAQTLL